MGFFDKIKAGLKKTRDSITGQISSMLHAFTKIDEELFEELEELLVMADVGMNTATEICDTLRARVKERGITDPNEIMTLLQEVVTEMVSGDNELHLDTQPSVILVIGVNGVGKTTTCVNLTSSLKEKGNRVLLCDFDPQANSTSGMGVDKAASRGVYDVLINGCLLYTSPSPRDTR